MVPADLAEVAAIEVETLTPWTFSALQQELEIGGAIQLVAVNGEARLLGWCCGRVVPPEAELLKIAVEEKSRKCGVAGKLLEHLFLELEKQKVTDLFLEVRSNNQAALSFYEKHGFFHLGQRPNYYTNPPESAILLQKSFLK